MNKSNKHRLRIVYEKLESAFDDPTPEVINPYYEGLVNLDIYLDPKVLNTISLTSWSSSDDVEKWKNSLDKQGQIIKKVIEAQLDINEKMYTYFVGVDNVSLYLSFTTKKDFQRWNRGRIIDNLL